MTRIQALLAVFSIMQLTDVNCNKFGHENRLTCHCNGGTCNPSNGFCSTGRCLEGWSGPSCQKQNVALGKPATQSSYYTYNYPHVSNETMSGYAVDGNTSHRYLLGLSSYHSRCVDMTGKNTSIGWWSVDLQQTYHLNTIKIYHRDRYLRRFTGVYVYIIDEGGTSTRCYSNTQEQTSPVFTINCPGIGRRLNFTQSVGDRVLNLCEVEVYVCSIGTFGDNCSDICYCKKNARCHGVTGSCPEGCLPGWTGVSCNQKCRPGYYGRNCQSSCIDRKCINMTKSCDHVSGQCYGGCRDGYFGVDCSAIQETISGALIGIIVSSIAVLIATIVLVILFFIFRRRKANASKETPTISGNRFIYSNQPCGIGPATDTDIEDGSDYKDLVKAVVKPTKREDSNIYINAEISSGRCGQQTNAYTVLEASTSHHITGKMNKDFETSNVDNYNLGSTNNASFLREFEEFVLDVRKRDGFQEMFEDLPVVFTSSYNISQVPENQNKNRYKEYYPYDKTRVILKKLQGDPYSDYINANYINGYNQPRAYIAAQGATQITINDFVRMIWEQKCLKVIMLTEVFEFGKIKCERYWPEKGSEQFNDIILTLEEENIRADYTIRQITMRKGDERHKFYHFQYTSWPDHDVPNIDDLLDFLRTVNRFSPLSDQPQLIHCSAGVGRTGTYIAIDIGLKEGEETGRVDVMHMIKKMRDQRKGMLQSSAQLQCVYESLLEVFKYGDTCKTITEFEIEYRIRSTRMVMGKLSLASQYQEFLKSKEKTAETRNVIIDGIASTAVLLPSRTSSSGYVMDRIKDFDTQSMWKVILNQHCSAVICIINNKNKNVICPPPGKVQSFGSLTLQGRNEEKISKYLSTVTVSASLNTGRESELIQVFILDVKEGKTIKTVAQQMKELLNLATIHDSPQKPIAVLSNDKDWGLLFCLLRNIAQRITLDEEVEIFYNVRKLQQQSSSSVIKSQEDYKEIFKFAYNYIKSQNVYENY